MPMMRALNPDSNTTWSAPLSSVSLPIGSFHARDTPGRATRVRLRIFAQSQKPTVNGCCDVESLRARYTHRSGIRRRLCRIGGGERAPHRGTVDLAGAVERQLRHDRDEARMRISGP